jgi:CubicO group peptidase (beta-lactamase class C family)
MDFTKVTNLLETFSEYGIPGCDLAIYLDGKEVYRHRTGYSNLEDKTPIAPDTLYPFYSMTKIVTCVSALRLYEEGRFLLSDPLSDYIPEFKDMTVQRTKKNGTIETAPAKNPIRIEDLFTMSSGITYNYTPSVEQLREDSDGNFTLGDLVLAIAKDPLYFEPGTHYHYGFSHDVLAYLIEVLTGKTLGQYFKENIFVPLGMEDTFFTVPEDKQHRFVTCYTYDAETKTHKLAEGIPIRFLDPDYKFEMGGGGLVSTIDDYAKFANTLCAGGTSEGGYRLISKGTIDLMRTNHLNKSRLKEFHSPYSACYGYGLGVRTMINAAAGGSNSPEGFGWSGLAGTHVRMDPSTGLTYVYAQQLIPSNEGNVYPKLRNVIYGCL